MNKKVNSWLNKIWPHVIIIVAFVFITLAYFYPTLQGKVLQQLDVQTSTALSHQLKVLEQKTGHISLWNSYLFSGMPAYHMISGPKHNIFIGIKKIYHWLFGFLSYYNAAIFFLYLLNFYLLLLTLKINKWLSAILSPAFALSSYNIIIIAVGHITKAYAIAFMPLVIAGFILIYEQKKYIFGGIILSLALGLQLATTHLQIVYYTGMLAGLYLLYRLILDLVQKTGLKHFIISTLVAVVATIFAVLPNTVTLWENYELSKYSIRGGHSALSQGKKNSGLSKSYAFAWSYGVSESLSIIIPDIKGGQSDYIGNDEKIMEKIQSPYKQYIAQQSRYWGPQPFTAGPVYFGVIIVFLFIFGLFIVRNPIKWWLLAATVLSIMLAWGKHFEIFTDLFFYYFPLFNKFRVVSMILVIASLTVPMLAALALQEIAENPAIIKQKLKPLLISWALTGGIALLIGLFPKIAGPLLSPAEQQYLNQIIAQHPTNAAQFQQFFSDLQNARALIVKHDAFRSFLYSLFALLALLYYSFFAKEKRLILYSTMGILILVDLWAVDRRYLSAKDFKSKIFVKNSHRPTIADKIIMKTKAKDFRVLNLTVSPFNDASTSYYHQSIGGYSAAKLAIYQDLIDQYLYPYTVILTKALKDTTTSITQVLKPMQVLHMLNTLYIIYSPNTFPILNPYAFGNAWLVNNFHFVNSAKQELNSLGFDNLKRTAVINKKLYPNTKFPELSLFPDSTQFIKMIYFRPDSLVYKARSDKPSFAVFSEIYYPKGWHAYIDGKPTKIFKTDYVLRGIILPPGSHTIIMVFKPKAYYVGRQIALVSSILLVLIYTIALAYWLAGQFKIKKQEK